MCFFVNPAFKAEPSLHPKKKLCNKPQLTINIKNISYVDKFPCDEAMKMILHF